MFHSPLMYSHHLFNLVRFTSFTKSYRYSKLQSLSYHFLLQVHNTCRQDSSNISGYYPLIGGAGNIRVIIGTRSSKERLYTDETISLRRCPIDWQLKMYTDHIRTSQSGSPHSTSEYQNYSEVFHETQVGSDDSHRVGSLKEKGRWWLQSDEDHNLRKKGALSPTYLPIQKTTMPWRYWEWFRTLVMKWMSGFFFTAFTSQRHLLFKWKSFYLYVFLIDVHRLQ